VTALNRPVRRTVNGIERRGLVVTLYPNQTIGLRPARTRKEHIVPLASVYRLAVEMTLVDEQRHRDEAREQARLVAGRPPRRRVVNRGLLR
jgi:hypothetical protein